MKYEQKFHFSLHKQSKLWSRNEDGLKSITTFGQLSKAF